MSEHKAVIAWNRNGEKFTDNRYKRAHRWEFDGGAIIRASASPHVVPPPHSDASAVDPEEAFVAALASCHMLWFLSIAMKRGHVIDSYIDKAVGRMEKDPSGKLAITEVTLRPHTVFGSRGTLTPEVVQSMHEEAHGECFLANSVKTKISTAPTFEIV